MAYSVINTVTNTASGSTSLVLNKPAGIAPGDILIAAIAGANFTPSQPSGFTLAIGTNLMCVAYRVCDGSEAASYTWTAGGTQNWVGILTCIRGVDRNLNVSQGAQNNGSGTTASFSPVNVPPGGMAIAALGENSSPTAAITWPPAGFTSIANQTNGGDTAAALAYKADIAPSVVTPGNVSVDSGVFNWRSVAVSLYKAYSKQSIL